MQRDESMTEHAMGISHCKTREKDGKRISLIEYLISKWNNKQNDSMNIISDIFDGWFESKADGGERKTT